MRCNAKHNKVPIFFQFTVFIPQKDNQFYFELENVKV